MAIYMLLSAMTGAIIAACFLEDYRFWSSAVRGMICGLLFPLTFFVILMFIWYHSIREVAKWLSW